MIFLDAFFRFSSITVLLLMAAMSLRDGRSHRSNQYFFFLCLSLTCLLVALSPLEYPIPRAMKVTAAFLNIPNTVLLWLFVESILNDQHRLSKWRWILIAIFCVPTAIFRCIELGWLNWPDLPFIIGINVLALGFIGHLAYVALSGLGDDLISKRRSLRLYFIAALLLVTTLSVVSEFLLTGANRQWLPTVKLAIIFPIVALGFFWIFQMIPNHFALPKKVEPNIAPELTARESNLYQRLMDEMEGNKAYLEPGLSISVLAARIGASDTLLRQLINSRLGHRNFSTFVNGYRIDAIKTALRNPAKAHLPILTIALETGFNSLPPFNRAFKRSVGMTPNAYRKTDAIKETD